MFRIKYVNILIQLISQYWDYLGCVSGEKWCELCIRGKTHFFSWPKKVAKPLSCLYRDRNADCNFVPLGSELVQPLLWPLNAVPSPPTPTTSSLAFGFNITSSKLSSLTLPSHRILGHSLCN